MTVLARAAGWCHTHDDVLFGLAAAAIVVLTLFDL